MDSGVGGLPYLELAKQRLPGEFFYYIADNRNYPYGEKEIPAIIRLVLELAGRAIEKFNPKCIIIACNTASVVALKALRETYSLPFVGVVPAVKPAAENSLKKRFGLLATPRTVKDDYVARLVDSFAGHCDVIFHPAGNLRDIVETGYFTATREEKLAEVEKTIENMTARDVDSIVLGCTHFIFLEEEFKILLGDRIQLIDSRQGVIGQLKRVMERENLLSVHKESESRFYLTANGAAPEKYRLFAEKYGLQMSGVV